MIFNCYIYNKKGACLYYREWHRPYNSFSEQEQVRIFSYRCLESFFYIDLKTDILLIQTYALTNITSRRARSANWFME